MRRALALAVLTLAVTAIPAGAERAGSVDRPLPYGQLDGGDSFQCAVADDGLVRCWGSDAHGKLGYGAPAADIGDDEPAGAAGFVGLGRQARAVAAGANHACAILDTGQVRCWGEGADGRLGLASTADVGDDETPVSRPVVNLGAGRTAKAITAGDDHTCAILDTGQVRCWGDGGSGRLGLGADLSDVGDDEAPAAKPVVDLGPGRTAKAISAGGDHTCAILDTGALRCWGGGDDGALGYGSLDPVSAPGSHAPVDLGPGHTAAAIALGRRHTCAVLDDATLRCWGLNADGQLGLGDEQTRGDAPTRVPALLPAPAVGGAVNGVVAGARHTCVHLVAGNALRCFGAGASGRLGTGSTADVGDDEAPDSVPALSFGTRNPAYLLSAGGGHTCGVHGAGDLRCWGQNASGELGQGQLPKTDIGDDESIFAAHTLAIGGRIRTTTADLSVALEVPPAPRPGKPFTVTVRLHNAGPERTYPTIELGFDSGSPTLGPIGVSQGSASAKGDTVAWSEIGIDPGSTETLTLVATVPRPSTLRLGADVVEDIAVDPDSLLGNELAEDDQAHATVVVRNPVAAPPAPGRSPARAPARDTARPVIRSLRLTRTRLYRHGRRSRCRLRFGLSEPASVRVALERRVRGRWRRARSLRFRGRAGRNDRRLSRSRLRPGRYRARVRAVDAAGLRSRLRSVRFTVLAR